MEASDLPVFVHQSNWQRRMLLRYGTKICLIDATYATTAYEMPLFMLCVPSNAGYLVVASFLVGDEQSKSIEAGLRTVARWCPQWQPAYMMSDYSESQISAVETVFPGMCHPLLYASNNSMAVVSRTDAKSFSSLTQPSPYIFCLCPPLA